MKTKTRTRVKPYTYEEVKRIVDYIEGGIPAGNISAATGRSLDGIIAFMYQYRKFKKGENTTANLRAHLMRYQREHPEETRTPSTDSTPNEESQQSDKSTTNLGDKMILKYHETTTPGNHDIKEDVIASPRQDEFIQDQSKRYTLIEVLNKIDSLKIYVEGLLEDVSKENERLTRENDELRSFKNRVVGAVQGEPLDGVTGEQHKAMEERYGIKTPMARHFPEKEIAKD